MSYYAVPPEGIDVMQEQIQDLEDCLDAAQERADEWQRIGVNLFWELHEADNKRANAMWWDEPTLQDELPVKYFETKPGKCIWEVLDDGKVYCKRSKGYPVCYLRDCDVR